MSKIEHTILNELLDKIGYEYQFNNKYNLEKIPKQKEEEIKKDEEKPTDERKPTDEIKYADEENVDTASLEGGSYNYMDFSKYIKPESSEYSDQIKKYLNNFDNIRNQLELLNILHKIIDFHKWYDYTSVYFTTENVGQSQYLQKINISEDDNFVFKKLLYGGDLKDKMDYKKMFKLIFDIMSNNYKTDYINELIIYIMYSLGKNVNYWLAKRLVMKVIGNIRPNLEDSLYSLVRETNIEIISSKKYKEIIEKIENDINKDVSVKEIFMLYHYEMFKNEAKNTNDEMILLNNDMTDTYKKIMYLVFEKVKNTFKQDKIETKYEELKNKLNYDKPLSITDIVKTLSKEPDQKTLLQKQLENKFFAVNTLKQTGVKYPDVFRGGKMFCGGSENIYSSKAVFESIYNNILKKMEEKKQMFNEGDKNKIKLLIEQLGKYEKAIYEILANMNKYITSDIPQKHDAVNYDMIARAVEQYENIILKYNKKSYTLFKDLVKLNNAVQQLRIDTITYKN